MLPILVVSAMVLQVATHSQPGKPQAARQDVRQRVVVAAPRVVFVERSADLRELCGVNRSILACTRFVGYELSAKCTDDGAAIIAAASFMPLMVVLARTEMSHEFLHVADVQKATEQYVLQLETHRYSSAAQCEGAASAAIREFPQRIQEFVRASNEKRHVHLRSR